MNTAKKAREKRDAERLAIHRAGRKWVTDIEPSHREMYMDKYHDCLGDVIWYDIDESSHRYKASVIVPGVRGQMRQIGRYRTLAEAKAAVEKEV